MTAGLPEGRWVEVATYPAELGGRLEGGAPSTIVVLRDITKARDAETAREAFLGVLSHELRTPVTAIFGYAKVLQRPSRRDDQAELLSDIEVEADRLYRIVEDLLALSRVEGGITIEGEPLLVQHLAGPVVASEARRWDRIRLRGRSPRWSAGRLRRADVRRTGPAQPGFERRQVQPGRFDCGRVRVGDAIRGAGDRGRPRIWGPTRRGRPPLRPVLPVADDRAQGSRSRDRLIRRPGPRRGHGWTDLGEASAGWRLRVRVQPAALR